MIDNRLKKCCEDCNYIDVFSDSTFRATCVAAISGLNPPPNSLKTTIGCKHMYVCKKYIESQESEE